MTEWDAPDYWRDLAERLIVYCDAIDGGNDGKDGEIRVGLRMCSTLMREAASALSRLATGGEVEGLETTAEERAYWLKYGCALFAKDSARLLRDHDRLAAEVTRLRAELAAANAALSPFRRLALAMGVSDGCDPHDRVVYDYGGTAITIGDFRAALSDSPARGDPVPAPAPPETTDD